MSNTRKKERDKERKMGMTNETSETRKTSKSL
jgi:hypothetical protein